MGQTDRGRDRSRRHFLIGTVAMAFAVGGCSDGADKSPAIAPPPGGPDPLAPAPESPPRGRAK